MPAGRMVEIALRPACGRRVRPAPVVTLRRTFSTPAVNDPHRASTSHRFPSSDLPQHASPYFPYNQAPAWLYARGAGYHRLPNAGPIG